MNVLTADNLAQLETVSHGFFTRRGGVSTGVYESLNCGPGSNDSRDAVFENQTRALDTLAPGGARLVRVHQIHSADAVCVGADWDVSTPPKADAMATRTPGLALGILTADCAPVLMADAEAGVIGAAHAGWRGALSGVVDSVIAMMEQLGAKRARIAAAVGPCIGQASYEVGDELRAQFLADDAGNDRCFAPGTRPGHWQFDLEAYVVGHLHRASVDNIVALGACTYAREDDFFSFRRMTHRGEADNGRQISLILLRK
ncbi:MAG: peptidoglycan editing factor PgeF [Rhizomicrobium sp.]|jgi:YfiH family protein